jgi:hypothetical protein
VDPKFFSDPDPALALILDLVPDPNSNPACLKKTERVSLQLIYYQGFKIIQNFVVIKKRTVIGI